MHGWSQSTDIVLYDAAHVASMKEYQRHISLYAYKQAMKRRKENGSLKIDQKHRRSPLRRAYEDGDMPGILAAIRRDVLISDSGCWEWQRQINPNGYGRVKFDGKGHLVHRLAALAAYGQPEAEPVVHHVCANKICCNPEHLRPVTHRDNNTEMMERNYYINRIAELEAALQVVDPDNSALTGYQLSA